jgi:hypothetical protein
VKKADHRAKPDVKKKRKVVHGHLYKKKREDKNQGTEGNTYEATSVAGTFQLPPDPGARMHMRQGPFGTK